MAPSATVVPTASAGGGGYGNGTTFSISLYNEAGESVKHLVVDQPAGSILGDFTVQNPAFAPRAGQQALILLNGQTYIWNGDNDNGQHVNSGLYWIKLVYRDSYGNVTAYIHSVVVLAVGNEVRVRIFNSAGEEVRTLLAYAYGTSQPTRIQPDKSTLVVGGVAPSDTITFDLGGLSVAWDGKNSLGQRVDSGVYTVQLESDSMGGVLHVGTTSVTVINVAGSVLGGARILPNPVPAGVQRFALVMPSAPAGTEVIGRLYNLAGELIHSSTNGMNPQRLNFDLNGRQVSGGVYILAVTARAPWGMVERQNYKLVMVR